MLIHARSQFLGLSSPRVIYVESFARVRSLSLSGKLLRPFVDRSVRLYIIHLPPIINSPIDLLCNGRIYYSEVVEVVETSILAALSD